MEDQKLKALEDEMDVSEILLMRCIAEKEVEAQTSQGRVSLSDRTSAERSAPFSSISFVL